MQHIQDKAAFLQHEYTKILSALDPDTKGRWGKMNVQQMVEHMSDYVRIGSGKDPQQLVTEPERLPRMQAFLASDKPFPENTPNVLMPDTPPAVKHAAYQHAVTELQDELDDLFDIFKNDPMKKVTNPFFGDLDYDMSIQLLYKHAMHHLRQFRAVE